MFLFFTASRYESIWGNYDRICITWGMPFRRIEVPKFLLYLLLTWPWVLGTIVVTMTEPIVTHACGMERIVGAKMSKRSMIRSGFFLEWISGLGGIIHNPPPFILYH